MKSTFHIVGLSCESCVKLTTMKLRKLPGVTDVSVDLKSGVATITSDPPVTLEQVQAALTETHYTAEAAPAPAAATEAEALAA